MPHINPDGTRSLSMKKEEAKARILIEWGRWIKDNPRDKPTGNGGFSFFGHLSTNKLNLLNFRCSGDKWQAIHGWLLNAGLVSD